MIEISISSELAAEHPRFMAECLQRGRHLTVFASVEKPRPIGEARQPWQTPSRLPNRTDGCGRGLRASSSLEAMPTLVRDPQPVEFERLLRRRRRLGQDLLDEVWEGVYHMNPAPHRRHAHIAQQLAELLGPPARAARLVPMMSIFNLGEPNDYRVPDGGLFRPGPDEVYMSTAALVVEIVSPDDETWEKLPFYAAHGVDEVLIVDPQERSVHWLALREGEYQSAERSALIELSAGELAERLDWPEVEQR